MRTLPIGDERVDASSTGDEIVVLVTAEGEEDVRRYKAPKPDKIDLGMGTAKPAQRLLGALFTRGQTVWAFKLSAAETSVSKYEKAFDDLFGCRG